MKKTLVGAIIMCLLVGVSFADSTKAKQIIKELQEERQGLEKQRKKYDRRLAALINKRRKLEHSYQSCTSFVGHGLDELTLQVDDERNLMEEEWKKFLKQKKRLDIKNQSLEILRKNIELQFKGKERGVEYDDKISEYASLFRQKYLLPYRELLRRYEHYISGMISYFEIVRDLTEVCQNKKGLKSINSSNIESKIDTMKTSTDEIFLLNKNKK
jgi:uncharacterized membrane-anchored protein YhcB (DUF1043 family)